MEKQQCSASGLSRGELKTLGLSSLGGILEFYDFIIVFFFAKIISQHFFPAGIGEFWAMLNTYGTFAAGYLARPLGGVVMAHFGDKFGRKNMFMLSIALMVIPTFSLAVIPTYETIGYAAPLFLILVRICQGIAIGGVFGLISIYLRRFLQETPVFKKMRESKALAKFPLEEVVKTSRFGIWISMFITWVLTGCIVVFILLMPGFVGGVLGFSPFETTYFQMGGLVCIVSSCWLTGRLADKHNPSTLCILFSAGFAVSSVAFFSLLYTAAPVVSEVVLAYFATCFFAGIMNFCPIFMCDVFPARIRFSGISFAYNIAYALSGAFTPQLSFALHAYAKTHPDTLGAMGLSAYIVFLALVSIGTALAMRRVYKNGGAAVSQMEFRPAP